MSEEKNIASVSIKVAPFWKVNPALWFQQLEAQFALRGITQDETKYYYAISAIESDVLQEVSDIIINPPQKEKYNALKVNLIKQFSDSEEKRLKKLLSELQLGDKKPSKLYREMKEVSSNKVDDSLLKTLWLQRLPHHMQAVLSVSGETIDKLLPMADKISEISEDKGLFEVRKSQSEDNTRGELAASSTAMEDLKKQVAELTLEIEELRMNNKYNRRERFRDQSRSQRGRSLSRGRSFCWYHDRFGRRANKCQPPCNFASSGN